MRWAWLGVAAACTACGTPQRSDQDQAPVTNADVVTITTPGSVHATAIDVRLDFSDARHELRAVGPDGTLYATGPDAGSGTLLASEDAGKTWAKRGTFDGRDVRQMACLADGTLLADTSDPVTGDHRLERSTDRGRHFHAVLPLGKRWLLQPHSIAELAGEVFAIEYQVEEKITPIKLYASSDGGATWGVRHVFEGSRHGHGLCADPARGLLWAMLGDATGALVASGDGGRTFRTMLGFEGVAVDATPVNEGLLFGRDALYFPARPAIVRVTPDGESSEIASLPGPSYSVHPIDGGGFLLGITRESAGDVYPQGEPSAFLFGSPDGMHWQELMRLPQDDPNRYARADVYWRLPDGRSVLTFSNVRGFTGGTTGFGILSVTLR